MSAAKLTFEKVIASPRPDSFSHAYAAGSLAVCLSLTKTPHKTTSDAELALLGKEILATLEAEYFTLSVKNLNAIKTCVATALEKMSPDYHISLVVASLVTNIAYLFIVGEGKVSIKRGEKLGVLLQKEETGRQEKAVVSASGFLEPSDVVILQTKQFSQLFPDDILFSYLQKQDISQVNVLAAPLLAERQTGAEAAVLFSFVDGPLQPDPVVAEKKEIEKTPASPQQPFVPAEPLPVSSGVSSLSQSPFVLGQQPLKKDTDTFASPIDAKPKRFLSHGKRIFLSIALLLGVVLVVSLYFSFQKQETEKRQKVFQSAYPQAKKEYDEAQGVLTLNSELATSDFESARKRLEEAQAKLPSDSVEAKQIQDLLSRILLAQASLQSDNTSEEPSVEASASSLLAQEIKDTHSSFFTQDDKTIYAVGMTSLEVTDKEKQTTKSVVTNDKTWTSLGGLGTYLGNVYVLDPKANQILKFVPSGSSYSQATYFTASQTRSLEQAVAMAIDTSIWVLLKDGSIQKFTRGIQDSLSISGLSKPFSSPTGIVTNVAMDNVYVLDKGNGRVVVLSKKGVFLKEYALAVVKKARDMDVDEKSKKIYILSQDKVYAIDMAS